MTFWGNKLVQNDLLNRLECDLFVLYFWGYNSHTLLWRTQTDVLSTREGTVILRNLWTAVLILLQLTRGRNTTCSPTLSESTCSLGWAHMTRRPQVSGRVRAADWVASAGHVRWVSVMTQERIFFSFFRTIIIREKQEINFLMVFDHRDKIKPQWVQSNPEQTLNFLFGKKQKTDVKNRSRTKKTKEVGLF